VKKQNNIKLFLSVIILITVVFFAEPIGAQSSYSQSSGTTTLTGQTFTSSTNDLSAVKVTGGTLNLSNSTISSSGNTSSNDNSSFYGLNAVILAYTSNGTAVINSSAIQLLQRKGANGYLIRTARATTEKIYFIHTAMVVMQLCAARRNITVVNDSAVTSGAVQALYNDRGSGTITVTADIMQQKE
jgi:hypothetical protein